MPSLTSSQIPAPADEQMFERASVILWRAILKDDNVELYGRRGKAQYGIDLVGCRNDDPKHIVGIQCKLKGPDKQLTENEIRKEVEKAKIFKPPLREYFIITTAPNDPDLQSLAKTISIELQEEGIGFSVHIWGWGVMQDRIHEHATARNAFDPEYSPYVEKLSSDIEQNTLMTEQVGIRATARFDRVEQVLSDISAAIITTPSDETIKNDFEKELDAEIDQWRQLGHDGKAKTAYAGLEKLKDRVFKTVSGRLKFRITANLANCYLHLGDRKKASALYLEAYFYAPDEPAAASHAVLGHLIVGEFEKAIAFGKQKLKEDPNNEGLAGYLIQSLAQDKSVFNPLSGISNDIVDSFPVQLAIVDFHRRRGGLEDWHQLIAKLYEENSDVDHVAQYYADAEMQDVLDSEHYKRTFQLTNRQHAKLKNACDLLAGLWDKILESESDPQEEQITICCNLIVGLTALQDSEAVFEVAEQAFKVAPYDQTLISRIAVAAVDFGHNELAQQALPRLTIEPDATILNFRHYAQTNQWDKIAEFDDEKLASVPSEEREFFALAKELAVIKIGPASTVEHELQRLMLEYVDNVRGQIIIAHDAKDLSLNDLADEAFNNARTALEDDQHYAGRFMVASYASIYDQHNDVIDILVGKISTDVMSSELCQLASAHAYNTPVRASSVAFFKALPKNISNDPYFVKLTGVLHYNRGELGQAEKAFKIAHKDAPDLFSLMTLVQLYYRNGEPNKVSNLLNADGVLQYTGSNQHKMGLAQLISREGRGKEALKLAYETLRSAPNDPKVALMYFGLLMDQPNAPRIPAAEQVATDIWVRLEDGDGKGFSFLIEEGESKPAQNIFAPADEFPRRSMGRKVGDTFTVGNAFGNSTEWTVKELKHKTLHALHDIMQNFETRFPGAGGFYSVKVRDDDIEPILEQVRKQSEAAELHVDLYEKYNCPLAMAAGKGRGGAIAFAQHLRNSGKNIVTCLGFEEERNAAEKLLLQADGFKDSGAVLDTYTAWLLASLDAFDIISNIFKNTYIPQSVLDDIRQMDDQEVVDSLEHMTVSYENGQYIRNVITPGDVAVQKSIIKTYLAAIDKNCTVLPIEAPDEQSEFLMLLIDTFEYDCMDSAFLARNGNVLLSEDLYYRQIAKQEFKTEGCWLQSVFRYAFGTGKIDINRYSTLMVQLAALNHTHLAMDALILRTVFDDKLDDGMHRFKTAAQCIGIKNADFQSHIRVTNEFMNGVWNIYKIDRLKKSKATDILLTALIRNSPKHWYLLLAAVHMLGNKELRSYLHSWVKGHFLSMNQYLGAVAAWQAKRAQHFIRTNKGNGDVDN